MKRNNNGKKEKVMLEFNCFDEVTQQESITVRLTPRSSGGINATITTGAFVIYAQAIYNKNDDTFFISYPSWKDKKGNYHDYCYCFKKDTIENLNKALNCTLDENEDFLDEIE